MCAGPASVCAAMDVARTAFESDAPTGLTCTAESIALGELGGQSAALVHPLHDCRGCRGTLSVERGDRGGGPLAWSQDTARARAVQ